MTSRIDILGIPIDRLKTTEVLSTIRHNLNHNIRTFIATPNPEMILASLNDEKFQHVLSSTDINIADGIGLLWAATYLDAVKTQTSKLKKILIAFYYLSTIIFSSKKIKRILPERVTGTDMMRQICEENSNNANYFLLGSEPKVSKKTSDILKNKYNLNIVGRDSNIAGPTTNKEIISKINNSNANALFVAYGAPKQELWLSENLPSLPNIKLAIGIGGAFDFLSGVIPRAPKIMRKFGLEWLYRLFKQPTRIKRIYNATIKFPLKVISSSF